LAFNEFKTNSVLRSLNTRKGLNFAAFVVALWLRLSSRILLIVISMLIPGAPAWGAGNLAFDAGLTEQYTDNSNLTATDPQSDLISTPRFGLAYSRLSAKTDAKVNFQISRDVYRRETQQNQTFPSLNAVVNWRIVPEHFTWALEDFASQNQIDVQDSPTTDNTQNVNTFITGPDGFLRFGESTRLQLGARFADSRFDVTNDDSTRAVGFARFFFDLSARSALSVNYDYSSTNFEDSANPDFARQDFFFQARTQRVRSDFLLDAGYTVIDTEGTLERNPLFRLSWNRRLTAKSAVGLAAAHVVSDSGLNLAVVGGSSSNLTPGGSVANTGDTFIDERLNFFYTNTGRRTTATITLFARDQNYDTAQNDQSNLGGALNISRRITPKLTASFLASYQETRFLDQSPDRVDNDTDLALNFSYNLGRWLAFNAGLTWRNRDSNDPTQDYTETRGVLGITYARRSL
jgi:Putative beta-barrel porin 2